jgi:Ni,Fe-hydrogenase III small subunit
MIIGALANRMPPALWILAIGPNITVIHRILHTWKRTKTVAPDSKSVPGSAPSPSPIQANISSGVGRPSPQFFSRTAGRGR